MAGSRANSRTTCEPTNSYEVTASHPYFTKGHKNLVRSDVVRELACEPAIFKIVS